MSNAGAFSGAKLSLPSRAGAKMNGAKYSISHTSSRRARDEFTFTRFVEIKCQLDATEVFIADLIVCSTCFGHLYAHHQEFKSIIQWLLPVVFRAVLMCPVCRMLL